MAGHAPEVKIPQMPHLKAIVITAAWHPDICDALVAGAVRGFKAAGISSPEVRTVAGSFELPLAAQLAFDEGFDLAVVVGVVVRGQTAHFDYVCQGVTDGVMQVSLSRSKPIGFGVLMCESVEQARARAGFADSFEDKGFDSALAALSVLNNKKTT
jgi:6,7-dimethyl-8-ribityllumazine synthase